jgi:hypothetical protein
MSVVFENKLTIKNFDKIQFNYTKWTVEMNDIVYCIVGNLEYIDNHLNNKRVSIIHSLYRSQVELSARNYKMISIISTDTGEVLKLNSHIFHINIISDIKLFINTVEKIEIGLIDWLFQN